MKNEPLVTRITVAVVRIVFTVLLIQFCQYTLDTKFSPEGWCILFYILLQHDFTSARFKKLEGAVERLLKHHGLTDVAEEEKDQEIIAG
jgi:hypothetical protein